MNNPFKKNTDKTRNTAKIPPSPFKLWRVLNAGEARELAILKEPELLEFQRRQKMKAHEDMLKLIYHRSIDGIREVYIPDYYSDDIRNYVIERLLNADYTFNAPDLITW